MKTVSCYQCKRAFVDEASCRSHAKAMKHQWSPSAPPPVVCNQCKKAFADKSGCQAHGEAKRHQWWHPIGSVPQALQVPQAPKVPRGPFSCHQCKKTFADEVGCRSHGEAKKHQWSPPTPVSVTAEKQHDMAATAAGTSSAITSHVVKTVACVGGREVTAQFVYCPRCFSQHDDWAELSQVSGHSMHVSEGCLNEYLSQIALHDVSPRRGRRRSSK